MNDKQPATSQPIKGYKVFNPDFTCNKMQYAENTEFKYTGTIKICNTGLHFCLKVQDCFKYYSFDPNNIVCEVEATGEIQYANDDSKACTDILNVGRRLTWSEVLEVANSGSNNTGHTNSGYRNSGNWNSGYRNSGYSNSGDRNSGDRNSGDWNSGDRNSGDWNSGDRNSGNWNSGDRNSGDRNSGDRNSGDRNSGNWNSGDRNSGDSNSGYRNAGAFCTDPNPKLILFDKLTDITVKEWEEMEVYGLMYSIDPTIWVPMSIMTDAEKAAHPKYETTEGYLKTIPMHEAWANFWGNLKDDKKLLFTSLPGFTADKFKEITGITI